MIGSQAATMNQDILHTCSQPREHAPRPPLALRVPFMIFSGPIAMI